MDQFAEQLVKKPGTSADTFKRIGIIALTVLITAVSVLLVMTGFALAVILPICAVCGAYFLLTQMQVEYEYSCTNGTLDIDKIIAQSKRRSMLSIDVSAFTAYGKAGECPESDEQMTTFSASGYSLMGTDDRAEEYYAEFEHPEHGKCCLYFTPDSHFREVLEPFLSRELRRQL